MGPPGSRAHAARERSGGRARCAAWMGLAWARVRSTDAGPRPWWDAGARGARVQGGVVHVSTAPIGYDPSAPVRAGPLTARIIGQRRGMGPHARHRTALRRARPRARTTPLGRVLWIQLDVCTCYIRISMRMRMRG